MRRSFHRSRWCDSKLMESLEIGDLRDSSLAYVELWKFSKSILKAESPNAPHNSYVVRCSGHKNNNDASGFRRRGDRGSGS